MPKSRDPAAPGVPTLDELLTHAARKQNEDVALTEAQQLVADVLIALLAELQAERWRGHAAAPVACFARVKAWPRGKPRRHLPN